MPHPSPPPSDVAAALAAASEEFRVPAPYLQAVAWRESQYDPEIVNVGTPERPGSGATGLLQIIPRFVSAPGGFEDRMGEPGAAERLTDPLTNARIGAWIIRTIADTWTRDHPDTLAEDWTDPRWVRLLAFGYGAGAFQGPPELPGGVARVVSLLEARGFPAERVTVETVQTNARAAGANEFVQSPRRMRWAVLTADTFDEITGAPPPPFDRRHRAGLDVSAGDAGGPAQRSSSRRSLFPPSARSSSPADCDWWGAPAAVFVAGSMLSAFASFLAWRFCL